MRGYGNGRLVPFILAVAAALLGRLHLMFVADLPWAAVGVIAVVAMPVLTLAPRIVVEVVISWLTGKPIRWN